MTKRKADGVERVYEQIKKRAMDFSFEPGQKVKEGELATEFGVSRIPIREALNRLVSEEFMTFVPNKGFFCRGIDAAEILSMYQLRAALEMWSFRTAARTAKSEDLESFHEFWASDRAAENFGSLDAYDSEFHLAMAGLSGNNLLVRQLKQINEKILAFRNLEIQDAKRRYKTLKEHEKILFLFHDRQAELGSLLLEDHILSSAEQAISAAKRRLSELK